MFAALDRTLPGLCTELVAYLHTQQAPPLRSALQTLINRLTEQPEQFLLILDDYHLLVLPLTMVDKSVFSPTGLTIALDLVYPS